MAIENLESIWDDTARFWDVDQAEKYLRTINHSFEELAEDPLRGKICGKDVQKICR
jgi:plasmid stabilization system protein ParE